MSVSTPASLSPQTPKDRGKEMMQEREDKREAERREERAATVSDAKLPPAFVKEGSYTDLTFVSAHTLSLPPSFLFFRFFARELLQEERRRARKSVVKRKHHKRLGLGREATTEGQSFECAYLFFPHSQYVVPI